MKTTISFILLAAAGCSADLPRTIVEFGNLPTGTVGEADGDDDPTNDPAAGNDAYAGGVDGTFSHIAALGGREVGAFEVLAQRQEEGPPEVRTRLHSCQKPQIAAIAGILAGFGVDLEASGDPPPAGQLLREGYDMLGGANYGARSGEAVGWNNAGAIRLLDIFVMAAPEIMAALPSLPQCREDGAGPTFLDEDGRCAEAAVTCLLGRPARDTELLYCDEIVASDAALGPTLAVAAILGGAHTCE
jgi:hypothetical protein